MASRKSEEGAIAVHLDDTTIQIARRLGEGNLSLGVRRAVAIASIRKIASRPSKRPVHESAGLTEKD